VTTHLTPDDSDDIGFVNACVFSQAISVSDLSQWAQYSIALNDAVPAYVYDLVDFTEPLFKISKVYGFSPVWERTQDEEIALFGIAYLRGITLCDCPVEESEALAVLQAHRNILDRFRRTFPFLEVEA
jgi:hypothetical protein